MKNAMKKLMAFALVAVMLVGVLPFGTSAATLSNGCDDEDPSACTNDFPMHDSACACVCDGTDDCYPASIGLKEYHQDGCTGLAALLLAEEEAAARLPNGCSKDSKFPCPNSYPNHDSECYMACDGSDNCYPGSLGKWDDNCHASGCDALAAHKLEISKSDEPIDDGVKCTNSYDCKHTGNLHVPGCPMIPCSSDETCDHGGWNHTEDCPYACRNSEACHADYHLDTCPKAKKAEDNTETEKPGSNNTETEKPVAQYAYAYIYVGNSNSAAKIYKNEQAFSIGAVVDKFDTADVEKHYAFDYYTLEGSNAKETDDTDVVQVGQTAHIYVKVTQSKLNHNKVYLQIFMNNDFDVPAKTINVTTMASENGLYREGNVKDLILEYFSAKNSEGIKIDGLYPSTGSWVAKFLEDIKVKNVSADQIIEMKEDDYVVFNIMVTNAKLKSASTADSSNPKTADNIYAVVTIMTASAAALAVAFYLNKKRAF